MASVKIDRPFEAGMEPNYPIEYKFPFDFCRTECERRMSSDILEMDPRTYKPTRYIFCDHQFACEEAVKLYTKHYEVKTPPITISDWGDDKVWGME